MTMLAVMSIAACGREKVMSDRDFVSIFCDMFLANAYCSQQELNCDSLDIYTPILEQYGYTSQDFVNKLSSFTKRKSARIGDVIEKSIELVRLSSDDLQRRLKIRNDVNRDVVARYRDTMWADSLITIDRKADSALVTKWVPVMKGSYLLRFDYDIEDDGRDRPLRLNAMARVRNRMTGITEQTQRYTLTAGNHRSLNVSIHIHRDYPLSVMQVELVCLPQIEGRMVEMTFRNVSLVYEPDIEGARRRKTDSLYRYRPVRAMRSGFESLKGVSPVRPEIYTGEWFRTEPDDEEQKNEEQI